MAPENAQTTVVVADSSPPNNVDLLLVLVVSVALAIYLQAVMQSLLLFVVVWFPILYLYAAQTCPSAQSFDAKSELKRVLRGDDLDADDPNKPKGLLGTAVARVQATVATEMATLPGYEVSLMNAYGACIVATARVPSVDTDFHWIGILGKWRFLYQSEISKDAARKRV